MSKVKTMLINNDFSEILMEESPNNAYHKLVSIYKQEACRPDSSTIYN